MPLHSVRQDLRFALRSLRRRRTFSVIAIATIALGIGAATAIYSVVDGILFRPLPYREAGRLVAVWQTFPWWRGDPILGRSWDRISLSIPEYRDWRGAQRSFEEVGIFSTRGGVVLGGGDVPEAVSLMRASASMLGVLRVTPSLGRYFRDDEDRVGAALVTVVSHEAWETRYQRDPEIVGKTVRFDDVPYTIIGVLPPALSLLRINTATAAPPFWIPAGQDGQDATSRGNHSYQGVGRLRAGVSLASAAEEAGRLLRGETRADEKGVRLEAWQDDQTRDVRQPLLILLAAVSLLLAIACVNVAILLLGESSAREHEVAARLALGARRSRVVRQLLTESLALALAGAIVGMALAWGGTRLLVALAPPRLPGIGDVGVDLRVLAFGVACTIGTGLLFGLAPAVTLSRTALGSVFRSASGQSAAGRGQLQRALVATEIALSLILLVASSLLTRSLERMTAVDPGFRADRLLTARVALPRSISSDSIAVRAYYAAALARLSALPGVEAVSGTSNIPFEGGNSSTSLEIEGRPTVPGGPLKEAEQRTVLARYFETLKIPLLAGRTFNETDRTGGALVVVVSQSLAAREWPGESPIGRRVKFQGAWREVVGVVGDTRFAKLSDDVQAMIYAPAAQRSWRSSGFLIRTRVEPASMIPIVRRTLRALDPSVPFVGSDTMEELIARSSVEERYRTTIVTLFGALAALLAATGMYGVTARAAAARTREMGIRIALGARGASIVSLLVRATSQGAVIGVAVGLAGAFAASRWLAPYLYGVTPGDTVAYASSVGVLVALGLAASWAPARRVSRIAPSSVLRAE